MVLLEKAVVLSGPTVRQGALSIPRLFFSRMEYMRRCDLNALLKLHSTEAPIPRFALILSVAPHVGIELRRPQ